MGLRDVRLNYEKLHQDSQYVLSPCDQIKCFKCVLGFGKTNLQKFLTCSYVVVEALACKITFKLTKMCKKNMIKSFGCIYNQNFNLKSYINLENAYKHII